MLIILNILYFSHTTILCALIMKSRLCFSYTTRLAPIMRNSLCFHINPDTPVLFTRHKSVCLLTLHSPVQTKLPYDILLVVTQLRGDAYRVAFERLGLFTWGISSSVCPRYWLFLYISTLCASLMFHSCCFGFSIIDCKFSAFQRTNNMK